MDHARITALHLRQMQLGDEIDYWYRSANNGRVPWSMASAEIAARLEEVRRITSELLIEIGA